MQLSQLFTLVALSAWGITGGLAAPLSTRSLEKRVSGSKWSFYDAGLGACGTVNSNSDFIVALNAEDFGGGYPGVHCGKTITMTYGGKTTQATIMDMCPGCPKGGLDLSRGLFSFFESQDKGIIYGDWEFGSGSPAPAPSPSPAPEVPAPAPEVPAPAPSPSSSEVAPPAPSPSSPAPEAPSPAPEAPAPSSSAEPSSSAPTASSSLSPVAPAEPTPSSSSASPVAPSPSSSPAPASPSPVTPAPPQDNGEYDDDDEDCEEWEYYDDEDDVAAPVASPPAAAPVYPPQAAPVQQQPAPSYNAPANDVKAPSPAPAQLAPVVEKPVANAAPIPGASTGGDSVEKQIQDNMNMIAQLLNKLTEMIKSLIDKSQKDA